MISPNGSTDWFCNNKCHNNYKPAREWTSGTKEWYCKGRRHRLNGPATEWIDGGKEWYNNGRLHREDGPAFEWPNGDADYWLHGVSYSYLEYLVEVSNLTIQKRIISNRLSIYGDGDIRWFNRNGVDTYFGYHNNYGPAVIGVHGSKWWYVNDKLHRLNGPAKMWSDGNVEYWINGKYYNTYLEYLVAVDTFKQTN